MKTILFLIPTYKYINSQTFVSFSNFFLNIRKYCNAKFGLCEGLYITEARSTLVERYYSSLSEDKKKKIDLVMWLDDDVVFDLKQILGLIEKLDYAGVDMLSALCFSRMDKTAMAYNFDFEGKNLLVPLKDIQNTAIVRCDAVGFGFLAMKPEVLDKMHKALGKWMFKTPIHLTEAIKEGIHLGEDVYFFMEAKKLGLTLGVDTDIVVGHYGGVIK